MKDTKLKYYIDTKVDSAHFWGDNWPYWDMLYKAIDECDAVLDKAHVKYLSKEKYGTYRCDMHYWCGEYSLLSGKWKESPVHYSLLKQKWINFIRKLQAWYINREFQKIYKKYPEVLNELIIDLSIYKDIKGDVDGEQIIKKYWIEEK